MVSVAFTKHGQSRRPVPRRLETAALGTQPATTSAAEGTRQNEAGVDRRTVAHLVIASVLLIGLLANAVAGWWWADPIVALAIGGAALREAREAWQGKRCGCC